MEQHRIKELCAALLITKDDVELHKISEELQAAIHEHVEVIRRKLLEVPAARHDLLVINSDHKKAA